MCFLFCISLFSKQGNFNIRRRQTFIINFLFFFLFCHVSFFALSMPSSAQVNIVLEYDHNAAQVIAPPDYSKISQEASAFSPKVLKKDWELLRQPLDIDENFFSFQSEYYKGLADSQREKTKFSAWEFNPILHMHINAFLCTGNKKYLDEFVYWTQYLLSIRMDNKQRVNFDGKILPQWERTPKYDIFSVSPFQNYPITKKEKIIKERGWRSLNFSDVNYSGLIIEPILRFVQVVKFNEIVEYNEYAMSLLPEIEKTIASHEDEWVDISEKSGYYIFPKNCPFFLDGVEMPVNEAAIFGSSLVRVFLITGKTEYLLRAIKMFNRWESFMGRDEFGYISYPYFTGLPYSSGWQENNSPSINTPEFKANKKHENFHKAALTIEFLILLNQAKEGVAENLLKEFFYVIKATSNKNIISQFPFSLGFGYPKNSYHVFPPTFFMGWFHLISRDESLLKRVLPYIVSQKGEFSTFSDTLFFQYMTVWQEIAYVEKTETAVPLFMEESGTFSPLWVSPVTGVVKINFKHTSPKHNVLYLYDFNDRSRRIRLDIDKKTGSFIGRMFLAKGENIDLRWDKISEHSAPATLEENKITFIFLEMAK